MRLSTESHTEAAVRRLLLKQQRKTREVGETSLQARKTPERHPPSACRHLTHSLRALERGVELCQEVLAPGRGEELAA